MAHESNPQPLPVTVKNRKTGKVDKAKTKKLRKTTAAVDRTIKRLERMTLRDRDRATVLGRHPERLVNVPGARNKRPKDNFRTLRQASKAELKLRGSDRSFIDRELSHVPKSGLTSAGSTVK